MRDTRLESATATFKQAEGKLARLQDKLADTSAKLLQAGIEVSSIDRKIEAFATSVDVNPSSASHLVGQRENARNVALLLEQAETFLESEVAKAKGEVIAAENAILKVQKEVVAAEVAGLKVAFVRENAKSIQRIARLANLGLQLQEFEVSGRPDMAGAVYPEILLGPYFKEQSAHACADETFRKGCFPSELDRAGAIMRSSAVADSERTRFRTGGYKALLPEDAELEPPYDFAGAQRRIANARSTLEYHRNQHEHFARRAEAHPGDEELVTTRDEQKAAVARWEANIARMEAELASHRA